MAELPKEIRDRVKAPHSLRVCLRQLALPAPSELQAFCAPKTKDPLPAAEGGDSWIRVRPPGSLDTILVVPFEDPDFEVEGFPHALVVESSSSRLCFLAAYFIARRRGGVVWVQKRGQAYAPAALAALFLGDEDLDERYTGATKGS